MKCGCGRFRLLDALSVVEIDGVIHRIAPCYQAEPEDQP